LLENVSVSAKQKNGPRNKGIKKMQMKLRISY